MFNLVAESLLVAWFFSLVSYKRYFEIRLPLRIPLLSASSHKDRRTFAKCSFQDFTHHTWIVQLQPIFGKQFQIFDPFSTSSSLSSPISSIPFDICMCFFNLQMLFQLQESSQSGLFRIFSDYIQHLSFHVIQTKLAASKIKLMKI
jgi:hypothetical protein